MLFLPPLASLLALVATAWDHHQSSSEVTASVSVDMHLAPRPVNMTAILSVMPERDEVLVSLPESYALHDPCPQAV